MSQRIAIGSDHGGVNLKDAVVAYLRGEEKFDGLDALVRQMRRDEAEARAMLSGVRPLSELDAKICF